MRFALLLAALLTPCCLHAQWEIQDSPTTAGLRGIHALGNGIAWASGSAGTVLRTIDDGKNWQLCPTPPNAEKLDFRGIQAFDASTAIVMSSGKGDLSRLYKTTDACKTWKLVFTNPYPEGFFDSLRIVGDKQLYLLSDPVDSKFVLYSTEDAGDAWYLADDPGREARAGDGAFAASNTALASYGPYLLFGTGGMTSRVYGTHAKCSPPPGHPDAPAVANCVIQWIRSDVPFASGTLTSGIYSLAARSVNEKSGVLTAVVVAVGGDYERPDDPTSTGASSTDGGSTWQPASTPPHGYRSSVAYSPTTKTWITVGPNGTDISTDDGRNWRALHPAPTEPPDADRNWNALSLPFVVGPHGRIGKLRPTALATPSAAKP